MRYNFDWNPVKEKQNIRKHQVNFKLASTVFRDIYQLTIYDEDHSEQEERWITIGLDETGVLRIVVHTFEQWDQSSCLIRIISARKATFTEIRYYQNRKL
ncbi:MAG TPA: BrnT family toxin [Allocoleopsis sp.]